MFKPIFGFLSNLLVSPANSIGYFCLSGEVYIIQSTVRNLTWIRRVWLYWTRAKIGCAEPFFPQESFQLVQLGCSSSSPVCIGINKALVNLIDQGTVYWTTVRLPYHSTVYSFMSYSITIIPLVKVQWSSFSIIAEVQVLGMSSTIFQRSQVMSHGPWPWQCFGRTKVQFRSGNWDFM